MESIYLQSMTDFVLKIDGIVKQHEDQDIDDWSLNCFGVIENYAKFLKQPLQLCFFVPCDENGNVLEEPKRWNDYLQFPDSFDGNKEWGELYNYELAKERVLFKGFEARMFGWKKLYYVKLGDNKNSIYTFPNLRNYTIENLVGLEVGLIENAIKQIGL